MESCILKLQQKTEETFRESGLTYRRINSLRCSERARPESGGLSGEPH